MRLFLPLPSTRNRCPALAAIGWRGCAGDVTGTGAELELGSRKVGIGERKESCFLEVAFQTHLSSPEELLMIIYMYTNRYLGIMDTNSYLTSFRIKGCN